MNLLNRIRNWLLAPLLNELQAHQRLRMAEVASAIKADIVNQIMQDTTQKMVSMNHLLATTYHTEERSLGLVFRAPSSLADGMSLLSHLAPILDFYYRRSGDYELFNVLIHNYEMVWEDVKKCVYTPAGISLESIKFEDLGVSGLLEALHVFAHGLNEYNIPDQYTAYNGGLHETAISQLYADITGGKITIDAQDTWGHLLGQALQYSAVRVLGELNMMQNAATIRKEVGEALLGAMSKIQGMASHGKK